MTPRRRQGTVLLAGAAAFYVLLGATEIGFHWTAEVLGMVETRHRAAARR